MTTTEPDGRLARGAQTKQAIVEAARAIIEETGRPALVKEIAERTGVAMRSVYYHFDDVETVTCVAMSLHPRKRLVVVYEPLPKEEA